MGFKGHLRWEDCEFEAELHASSVTFTVWQFAAVLEINYFCSFIGQNKYGGIKTTSLLPSSPPSLDSHGDIWCTCQCTSVINALYKWTILLSLEVTTTDRSTWKLAMKLHTRESARDCLLWITSRISWLVSKRKPHPEIINYRVTADAGQYSLSYMIESGMSMNKGQTGAPHIFFSTLFYMIYFL